MKKLIAVLAAGLLVLSACAGGDEDAPDPAENPEAALTDALNALSSSPSTFELSLQSTPESLEALASEDGGTLAAEDAEKILNSSFVVSSNNEQDPADAKAEFVVNIDGEPSIELRVLENALYAHADVEGILETFGQDTSQLDAIGQQAAASGLTFVQPAIDGEWLAIEGLQELGEQFGAASPAAEEQEKLVKDLTDAFKDSSEVTSEGSDDVGEHLVATLQLKPFVTRFTEIIQGVSGVPAGTMLPSGEDVPDEEVSFDIWVADGRIAQVEFDFLQLEDLGDEPVPEGVDEFALRVAVEEWDADLEVPEDAVEVDTQALGQIFSGMLGGGLGGTGDTGTGGGTGGAFDCSQLEGAPPEVVELYAEECPQLQ